MSRGSAIQASVQHGIYRQEPQLRGARPRGVAYLPYPPPESCGSSQPAANHYTQPAAGHALTVEVRLEPAHHLDVLWGISRGPSASMTVGQHSVPAQHAPHRLRSRPSVDHRDQDPRWAPRSAAARSTAPARSAMPSSSVAADVRQSVTSPVWRAGRDRARAHARPQLRPLHHRRAERPGVHAVARPRRRRRPRRPPLSSSYASLRSGARKPRQCRTTTKAELMLRLRQFAW